MTLAPHPLGALAPLPDHPQFVLARRADKVPVGRDGSPCNAQDPAQWRSYPEAAAELAQRGDGYGLGFVLTPPWVVIDIDHALQPDGTWSLLAQELCASLPGAVVEVSQSGAGLHIWCRHRSPPAHSCKNVALRIEAYSQARYIMLGTGAVGTMADECAALPAVLAHYFPPAVSAMVDVPSNGPRADYRGPADDDGLLALLLGMRPSADAAFGAGVTFTQLWAADHAALARRWPAPDRGDGLAYDASSADAALAQHLAWGTGCDAARMDRLMRGSGLMRDKWERADYLPRTIERAIGLQRDVLGARQGAADVQAAPTPAGVLVQPAGGALVASVHDLPPFLSEDALAIQFVESLGTRYHWTAGMGWMVWGGSVWRRDDDLSRYDDARRLCRAAANMAPGEAERRRLTSAKSVQSVLTLAQSDRRIVVPASAWDADPLVLNTPAGLIDLRSGAECDRALHLSTQCTTVAPDFNAAAPVFTQFLAAVFQGDHDLIAFVQRVLGYALTGSTREQVLLFFYGSGANGKSTLVDLLVWLIGSYALKLPAYALMAQRNGEQHPTGIAQLRGKRVAISSELEEGQFFNEALVKELTGDATMTARFMRGDFFQFEQTQKHVIVGNFKPRLRGGDPALARRMVLVPFDAVFTPAQRNPDMLKKLKAEGPAVLAWAVRGAIQWHAEGLGIPDRVRGASADYMAAHDDVREWIDERCAREGETRAADLYADFRRWKEQRGEHAPSLTVWGERMQRLPGMERRRSNGWRYSPIRIKPHGWGVAK